MAAKPKRKHPVLNFIISFFMMVFYIVCVGALFYPYISDKLNEVDQYETVVSYDNRVRHMEPDVKSELLIEAQEYNRRLLMNPIGIDPDEDQMREYNQTFQAGDDGIIGHISIPNIGVELMIYHTVEEPVLQVGVGHLPGTSFPVGGKGTHSALSGHTGLVTANLFTNLDRLEIGDCFYITVLEDVLTYRVDDISVVLPYEVSNLAIDPNEDYCTLITCTPYGVNSHRLLVRGTRVPTIWKDEEEGSVGSYVLYGPDENRIEPTFAQLLALAGVAILAITAVVIVIRTVLKVKKRMRAKRLSEGGM